MRLLMRCDGGPGIGVGHVVRSLAIAEEAVARGHEVAILGRIEGDFLQGLAASVGPELTLLGPSGSDQSADLAGAAAGHDVLHVDHYDLPDGLLDAVAARGAGDSRPVLCSMADGAFGARPSDLMVDPTVDAEWSPPQAAARWHLRGARFVALRRSVTELRGSGSGDCAGASESTTVRVLVVMGGEDPTAFAPKVVDALGATGLELDVTVVATGQTRGSLIERVGGWPRGHLHVTDPTPHLPTEMARADLVVTAAGTSVWELCAMSRPMAVVAVVDNQLPGYEALLRAGAAVGLGARLEAVDPGEMATELAAVLTDAGLRARLAAAAGGVVDGRGAWRLVRAFEEVLGGAGPARGPGAVVVRPVTLGDAELLWRWRNDPATRENSRSHEPVPLEAHLDWLRAALLRADRHLLVGEAQGSPVGTVRWDHEGQGEWEVSITVAPESRGRGVAAGLLSAGEAWLAGSAGDRGGMPRDEAGVAAYLAAVHTKNVASRRLFLGSGYLPDSPPDHDGFERFVKTA